jgi:3-oxoadipate enol-lactonase
VTEPVGSLASTFYLEGMPDAPICVFSSSLGTTHELWDAQLEAFTPRLQLVRYDHPGHGGSPVPTRPIGIQDLGLSVIATLDRLGLERASFCGISLGGCVGMWLAAHAPRRVERLVLACTSPRFPAEVYAERAAAVREHGIEPIADAVVGRWVRADHPRRAELREQLLSTAPEGYARCCEALAEFDARPFLDRIAAPTLVIHGGADPAVSCDDVALLTERIPDSRLVVLEDAKHLANVDDPDGFATAVLEFLA